MIYQLASHIAGNTGVSDEIVSIADELKREIIIAKMNIEI